LVTTRKIAKGEPILFSYGEGGFVQSFERPSERSVRAGLRGGGQPSQTQRQPDQVKQEPPNEPDLGDAAPPRSEDTDYASWVIDSALRGVEGVPPDFRAALISDLRHRISNDPGAPPVRIVQQLVMSWQASSPHYQEYYDMLIRAAMPGPRR
jgi:hypothetical protein